MHNNNNNKYYYYYYYYYCYCYNNNNYYYYCYWYYYIISDHHSPTSFIHCGSEKNTCGEWRRMINMSRVMKESHLKGEGYKKAGRF